MCIYLLEEARRHGAPRPQQGDSCGVGGHGDGPGGRVVAQEQHGGDALALDGVAGVLEGLGGEGWRFRPREQ